MARVRNWCFTSFEESEPEFTNETINYYLYQRELCPDTGRKHWQGCIKFKHPRAFNGLHKRWPLWHWEAARNWAAAKKYCSKTESRLEPPIEFGTDTAPNWQGESPSELWESNPDWMLRHHRAVASYNGLLPATDRHVKTIFIWGTTGVGKSHSIHEHTKMGTTFWHSGTKWWDGYNGQQSIIIDDFRGQWDFEYLLRVLDKYPMKVETKGGFVNLQSCTFYITSNLTLTELYNTDISPLKRRISFYMHAEKTVWNKMY